MKQVTAKRENIMVKRNKLNNKGFAIESVIASGIVIFGMCTIITLITFGAASFNKSANAQIATKQFRDEVADNYLNYLNDNDNKPIFKKEVKKTINGKKYTYSVEVFDVPTPTDEYNKQKQLQLKDKNGKVVLTVIYKSDSDDHYSISKWNYGE